MPAYELTTGRASISWRVITLASGMERRGEVSMEKVIARPEGVPSGGRNTALNHAAWTLGHRTAAGALEQADLEDELYVAALSNRLVHDDGERQTWATIRSGLGAGLQQPIDLDAQDRPRGRRRR